MIEMREEEVVEEVGGMTGLHLEAILPLDVEVRRRDHVCSWQQGLLVLVVEEEDGGRGKGRKKNHGVQVAGMEIVPPGATHLQEGALLQEGVHPQGGAHLHGEAALLGGMKEEVMEEVGDVEVVEVDLLQGEVLHPGGALLQDVDHLLGEAPLQDGEEVLTMEVDLGGLDLAGVMTGALQEGDRLQGEAPLLVGALHLAVGLHQGGDRLKGGDTRHAEDHPLAEMRAVVKEVLGGEEVVEEEDLHQGETTRWTTPLLAKTSVAITVAFPADDSMVTAPSALVTVISSPPTVFSTVLPAGISPALTGTGNTCLKRTAVRASLSSKRPPKASAGTLANASLVGAKTVNVPSPLRVSTRPAALTAVTRVDKLGVAIAAAAMLGNSATLGAGAAVGAALAI